MSELRVMVARFGGAQVLMTVVLLSAAAVLCGLATVRPQRRRTRLALGLAVVTVLVATALPRSWPPVVERGDLEATPLGDTLGRLPEVVAAPGSLAAALLLLNAAIYVPVGWSAALILGRRRLALATGVVLSVLVELLQFLALGRVAATDDVLTNAFGSLVGAAAALPAARAAAGCAKRPSHRTRARSGD